MSVVYRIYNIVTHKFQIGSAEDFKQRKSYHLSHLRGGYHHNSHLQNAYDCYGEDAFIFFVESTHETRQQAYDTEQRWLDQFYGKECCYNQNPYATNPPGMRNKKHSTATIEKMRLVHSKSFSLRNPSGEIVNGVNLTSFAQENNLNARHIWSVLKGYRKSHKGWRKNEPIDEC